MTFYKIVGNPTLLVVGNPTKQIKKLDNVFKKIAPTNIFTYRDKTLVLNYIVAINLSQRQICLYKT